MFERIMSGLLCTLALAMPVRASDGASAAARTWVGAWMAAPSSPGPTLAARTVRQIVRTSLGGSAVRLRLSNLFGTAPVTIGPVRLARHAAGSAIRPGSSRAVTFGGRSGVTLAAGGDALSDPVDFPVAALEELAVSLYVQEESGPSTVHDLAIQTAYIARGDATAAASLPASETDTSRFFLTDVEVAAAAGAGAVVVVGDSISDGVGSTLDRNARWPDALADRLQSRLSPMPVAVLNAGIAGNRILNDADDPYLGPSILARFDRDALGKAGARWIVLLSGSNDISAAEVLKTPGADVSAQQIIEGMRSLIARAHAKGLRIAGATLLPKGSADEPLTPAAKARREAVNAWIRHSGEFDAVVDFQQAMRDPAHRDVLLPAYDSGDHVHPNDAGYRRMAATIDLRLFAGARAAGTRSGSEGKHPLSPRGMAAEPRQAPGGPAAGVRPPAR